MKIEDGHPAYPGQTGGCDSHPLFQASAFGKTAILKPEFASSSFPWEHPLLRIVSAFYIEIPYCHEGFITAASIRLFNKTHSSRTGHFSARQSGVRSGWRRRCDRAASVACYSRSI